MLTNARMDNPTADRSATTTATSTTAGTTTAGTTGTTAGTTSAAGAMNHEAAMAWMLAGGSDLDKHVGHKIQVTGRTSWENPMMDHSRTPDTTTSATGTAAGTVGTTGSTTTTATEEQRKDMRADQPRLDVQSVKMIAASCS
jgi:hypothetical protein